MGKMDGMDKMDRADKPRFVYVTYISASPERVWEALTSPETTVKYWRHVNLSDWRPGSRWEHREGGPTGQIRLGGKVLESDPPRRLVLTWAEPQDALREDRHSRVTFELEPIGDLVRLTVIHDRLEPDSEMLQSISRGWPKVLSSLKSLLEVGTPLPNLW